MSDQPETKNQGPLAGFRILDLTSVIMGPYCTQILADMGAEVIKIESPDGDIVRDAGPFREAKMGPTFMYLNRGKKSVVIDLKTPEGREICLGLAKNCDVFIHSMRPAALAKLGLDSDVVTATNPSLIYCNLYGFGVRGRYSGRAAYDDTIQAISGMAMLQQEVTDRPQYVPTAIADKICGITAVYALLAALLHRERKGEAQGQVIDVPMFETMASFLLVEHLTGALFDPPLSRPIYPRMIAKHREPYQTADGYIAVLVYNDKQLRRFAAAVGKKELLDDVRFKTVSSRQANIDAFYAIIKNIMKDRTTDEWVELLDREEIPSARLNHMDDLFVDPHLQDVGFFETLTADEAKYTVPRFPLDFYGTPVGKAHVGPKLGNDTCSVLRDSGFSEERIAALLGSKVVFN